MAKKTFSIVVPLYKGAKNLPFLLAYFEKELLAKENIELIFVVDGCAEKYDFILFEDYKLKIIVLDTNIGQIKATIKGMLVAENDYIVTVDQDVNLYNSLLTKLIEQKNECDIVYIDLLYKKRKFYRKIGSFIMKVLFYIKSNKRIFRNGSSYRKISKPFFDSISDGIKNTYNIDMFLLNNYRTISFIPYTTSEDNKSSYSLIKLIKHGFLMMVGR